MISVLLATFARTMLRFGLLALPVIIIICICCRAAPCRWKPCRRGCNSS
jgi:hypothetical protein